MATLQITLTAEGIQVAALEKRLKKLYPRASVTVHKERPARSRSERYSEAQSNVSDAKSAAEELKDEVEQWKDNLPENLQDGDKASQLDEAISQLEEFMQHCEDAEGIEVEFPGMFG